MSEYKLQEHGVKRMRDGASIPNSNNRDWKEYQEWLSIEGNIPEPEFTPQEIQLQKEFEMDSMCSKQILSGLIITELQGESTNRWYSTSINAQTNISALFSNNLGGKYVYLDLDNNHKMRTLHTREEITELFEKGIEAKQIAFDQLEERLIEINQPDITLEELQNIKWI